MSELEDPTQVSAQPNPVFITMWLEMAHHMPVSGWRDVVALLIDYLRTLEFQADQSFAQLGWVQVVPTLTISAAGAEEWRFTVRSEATGRSEGVVGFVMPNDAPSDLDLDIVAAWLRVALIGRLRVSTLELVAVQAHSSLLLQRAGLV